VKRDELGLILAGGCATAALFSCWLGHWVIAVVFGALVGGALAVASEADR
jgi:hypothetical protein